MYFICNRLNEELVKVLIIRFLKINSLVSPEKIKKFVITLEVPLIILFVNVTASTVILLVTLPDISNADDC